MKKALRAMLYCSGVRRRSSSSPRSLRFLERNVRIAPLKLGVVLLADIGPVDKGGEVWQHKERHESKVDLSNRSNESSGGELRDLPF